MDGTSLDLSTDKKGAIAEPAIAHAAIQLGIDVYKPLSDGTRADLVFDLGRMLPRVQCKRAPLHGDAVLVRCYQRGGTADGARRTLYTHEEIDAIGAYCADLDRSFSIPAVRWAGRSQLHLRVAPSLNNRRERVNWADDYAMESLESESLGP